MCPETQSTLHISVKQNLYSLAGFLLVTDIFQSNSTTKASRNGEGTAKYRGGIYLAWRKSMLLQMQKDKLGKASTGSRGIQCAILCLQSNAMEYKQRENEEKD